MLGLAAAFQVASLVAVRPGGYLAGQTDYEYYYAFARLSNLGLYPFVDFWLEYPPLFPWLAIGAYKLSLLFPAWDDSSFLWFRWLLGGALLAFHLGCVTLVYLLALRLHGLPAAWQGAALYSALFTPLFTWMVWFEPLPLFFLLLGVYLAVREQVGLAGLAAGLGFMAKLVPALALLAALKAARTWPARVVCLVAAAIGASLVAAPLLPHLEFLRASFLSMLARSPWESVWAVADGYVEFGRVAPLSDHVLAGSALWSAYPPAPFSALALPALLVGGAVYLALWWRSRPLPRGQHLVALAGLAVLGLLVLGKGYSPQFLAYALPFVLLVSPDRYGLGYALGLGAVNLAEWPLYHQLLHDQPAVLAGLVVARNALLLAVAGDHLAVVLGWVRWAAVRRWLCPLLLAGLAAAALIAVPLGWSAWLDQQARLDPYAGPLQLVRERSPGPAALVFTDDTLYYHFYPYTWHQGELLVFRPRVISPDDLLFSSNLSEAANRQRLADLLERYGSVWLIAFEDDWVAGEVRQWLEETASLRQRATYDDRWRFSAEQARDVRAVVVEAWQWRADQ
ncbi:MAG: DUF2029 domain-containing protein [Chloroflexi bacterium]|nr:DUF2029 domain-containing protein [Chloroflexota bacterium]